MENDLSTTEDLSLDIAYSDIEECMSLPDDEGKPMSRKLASLQNLRKTNSLDHVSRKVPAKTTSMPHMISNQIEKSQKRRVPVVKLVMSFQADVIAHCGQISNPKAEDRMAFGHFETAVKGHSGSFLAVFDGHGGKQCAHFCSENISKVITKFFKKKDPRDFPKMLEKLPKVLLKLEDKWMEHTNHDTSGSTALILIYFESHIYLINVGDSRAVYIPNDLQSIHSMNIEQTVEYPGEVERLHLKAKACGYVHLDSLNNANLEENNIFQYSFERDPKTQNISKLCVVVPKKLNKKYKKDTSMVRIAVSSTVGDARFGPILSPNPSIFHQHLPSKGLFLLATDGLWDVMSNDQVLEFLKNLYAHFNPSLSMLNELSREGMETFVRLIQVKLTREAWAKYGVSENMRDDITLVVAYL
eukprot:TRINITY_DN10084_c0_g1_i1.p1 TRINITY_DN10084_c0_g1~~TRINITY_DN10084_c0_g1_i1.p1  ORF type:complete len:414 (+),score=80.44 TRINITY_DN10084_c0_g1_i1:28-1269(+)